jgi:hypothetical protein
MLDIKKRFRNQGVAPAFSSLEPKSFDSNACQAKAPQRIPGLRNRWGFSFLGNESGGGAVLEQREGKPMQRINLSLGFTALLLSAGVALAQSDTAWNKSYPVSGQPNLVVSVGDSHLNIHSCQSCKEVRITVTMENTSLSKYTLEESQSGDTIHFSLKEKTNFGLHADWHAKKVLVDVETPRELTLDASSSDGGLTASDLHGNLTIHTSDGSQDLEGVSGNLKLRASDGALRLHNATGTLEARTSDGSQEISGSFSTLELQSSDGSISVALAEGSKLNAESRIESHDGSVTLKLPKSFQADLAVSAHDGSIKSTLPLVVEGYNSNGNDGHEIHGKYNGGGSLLTIHTNDGSVHLSTM